MPTVTTVTMDTTTRLSMNAMETHHDVAVDATVPLAANGDDSAFKQSDNESSERKFARAQNKKRARETTFEALLRCSCMTCNPGCSVDNPPFPPSLDEKPIEIHCEEGHGQCHECAEHQVLAFCNAASELEKIKCTYDGCNAIINDETLKKVCSHKYAEYIRTKAERQGHRQALEAATREAKQAIARADTVFVVDLQESAQLCTPCCETPFAAVCQDAIVACNANKCQKLFCAWCFELFDDINSAHVHLKHSLCTVAPDSSYFFETVIKRNQLRNAWRARQFASLAKKARFGITVCDPFA